MTEDQDFLPERVNDLCADAGPCPRSQPRLSPEEIADYHARFISCNAGFAEPDGLIRPAPSINTPILLSHGPDKALDMLLERLREPWERMSGAAAKKINRILVDRREAIAALELLREELNLIRQMAAASVQWDQENLAAIPSERDGENHFSVGQYWRDRTKVSRSWQAFCADPINHPGRKNLTPNGGEAVHGQVVQPIRDEQK